MLKSFQYQNATIGYRVEGKGKPVILVHGFGEDSQIWDEQIEFLKEHCLLIVPDLPGSGRSSVIDYPPAGIGIDNYADCLYHLLQNENIRQCTMLGHSMGGYITLAFAEKYPLLLSSLGLIHSSAFADSEEKKASRQRGIEMMEQYGAYAFLKNTIPNLFSKQFREAHPEKVEFLIESAKKFSKGTCQQYYRAMMNRPDRTHVLRGNPLPVLFVIGTEDVAAPLTDVLQQTHLPDCSYIHILENTGHMGMWEAATLLNRYLLDFITH